MDATGTVDESHATNGQQGVQAGHLEEANEGEEKARPVYLSVSGVEDSPTGVLSKESFTSLSQADH